MTKRLYYYVDETGQDTQGRLFIVGIVIADSDDASEGRDELAGLCRLIEQETGKRAKWHKTTRAKNAAYMRRVIGERVMQGRLCFAVHYDTREYVPFTVNDIERAIRVSGLIEYRAFILFDGLPRSQEQAIGAMLKKRGVLVYKVRGADDETDVLIRLADAVCGLVREATEGNQAMLEIFNAAIKRGVLRDVADVGKE